MIKDWLKNIYFDSESVLDQGSAADAPVPKTAASWDFYNSAGIKAWIEHVYPPLAATGELTLTLQVTEQQDTASFLLEQEKQAHPGGGWLELPLAWPALGPDPLRMHLHAVESQDTASFLLEFDYTDDELVLSLMMAAWDEEEQLV